MHRQNWSSSYNRNDTREDEVERLEQLIKKKKFEILIPEIATVKVTSANPEEDKNAKGAGMSEDAKASTLKTSSDGNIQGNDQQRADGPKKSGSAQSSNTNDETSVMTNTSVKGEASSSKMSPLPEQAAVVPQVNGAAKIAPPVPTFAPDANAAKAAQEPAINASLKYKPLFKMPACYIKNKEAVYEGYENFSFKENNYEMTQKDIKFLETSKANGQLTMSHSDFEKVIDVFEKCVFLGESQSKDHLVSRFQEIVPEYAQRISKQSLEYIYQNYWKDEREKRKRSFMRMFWEKADFDDQDLFSAFRKRQKERMKLRRKTKYEIDSYFKMFELRSNCLSVLNILQDQYKREQLKQRQNAVDQAIFEMQFDNMLKDRNLT